MTLKELVNAIFDDVGEKTCEGEYRGPADAQYMEDKRDEWLEKIKKER